MACRDCLEERAGAGANATVVTTSYYPIVSEQSDLASLANLVNLYNPSRRIAGAATVSLRNALAMQAWAFHDEYVRGVGPVVRAARPLESAAVVSSTPQRAGEISVSGPSRTAGRRTAFVQVPFQPENAYGSRATWLWKAGEIDQAATARRDACAAAGFPVTPSSPCALASLGHPNPSGAQAYAQAVIGELRTFVPEWKAEQQ
ncbi:MAG: hypothetical protein ACREOF_13310 [Gemmatimonadales bacterium]